MGKLFECGECVFVGEIQHLLMRLDHFKIESYHPIEERLIGSKPRTWIGMMVQDLLDVWVCFRHGPPPLATVVAALAKSTTHETPFQPAREKVHTTPPLYTG